MRAIVNMISPRAIIAAGWQAKAIPVNDKNQASLIDVLKATALADGTRLYDLIAESDTLKGDWALHVNGEFLPGASGLSRAVKDSTQIHVEDSGFINESG